MGRRRMLGKSSSGNPNDIIFDVTVTSGSPTFQLPTFNGGTYNFEVFWGDSTSDTITVWNAAARTHTYAAAGTYTIVIRGTFVGWRVGNYADRNKLVQWKQWGNLGFGGNATQAFHGCNNLIFTATDTPNLAEVGTLSRFFENCTSISAANPVVNLNEWHFPNATTFFGMFWGCTNFNQSLSNWDMSAATDTSFMFIFCANFNQNINSWNVSNVTNMSAMFRGCTQFNQPLNNWNVSKVLTFGAASNGMFTSCINFNQSLNDWVFSTIENINLIAMFQGATSYNQPLNNWNTQRFRNMANMFDGATSFNQDISGWDTSNVVNTSFMFLNASSFNQNINGWDISSITTMQGMFQGGNSFQGALNALAFSGNINLVNFMFFKTGANIYNTANYDLLLIHWENRVNLGLLGTNRNVNMGGAKYTAGGAAEAARTELVNTYGWTITDGGPA